MFNRASLTISIVYPLMRSGTLVLATWLLLASFNPVFSQTLEQAADSWVDAEAQAQTDNILRDVERQIKLEPDVKKNLKSTIKSLLKDALKDRLLNDPQTLAMQSIIDAIEASLNTGKVGRGACQQAAVGLAWGTVNDIRRVLTGAADVYVGVFESAINAPGKVVKKLGGDLLKTLGKEALDQIRKALEKALDEFLKNYVVETLSRSTTKSGCPILIRVVWNKKKGVFKYAIIGDCNCKKIGKVRLSRWSVTGWGTAAWIGEEAEKANAENNVVPKSSIKGTIIAKAPKVAAVCCKDENPPPYTSGGPWDFSDQESNLTAPQQPQEEEQKIDCSKIDCEKLNKQGQAAFDEHDKAARELSSLQSEIQELDKKLDEASPEGEKPILDELNPKLDKETEIKERITKLENDLFFYCAQWKSCDCSKKLKTYPDWVKWCDEHHSAVPDYGAGQTAFPASYTQPAIAYDNTQWCTYGGSTTLIPVHLPPTSGDGDQPEETPEGDTTTPISTGVPKEDDGGDGEDEPDATTQDKTTDTPQDEETSGGDKTSIVSEPRKKDEDEEQEPPTVTITIFVKTETTEAGEQSVAVTGAALMLNGGTAPALPNTAGAVRDEDTGSGEKPVVAETDDKGKANLTVPAAYFPNGQAPKNMEISVTTPEGKIMQIDPKNGNNPNRYLAAGLVPFITSAIALNGSLYVVLQYPKTQTALIAQLIGQSSNVIRVQINYCRDKQLKLNDPFFNSKGTWDQPYDDQWGIKRVGFTAGKKSAWSRLAKDHKPVVVAVIDTGIDWNHKDFSWDNLWINADEVPDNGVDDDKNGYIDDVIGWDFMGNTNKPWDRDGHGTFVSGIIAATQNNGVGIAGINPSARIMVLKALNSFGHTRASYIAQSLIYAVDNGARVINLSVGGKNQTDLEREAIDYAHAKGAVIVVAAGNEGLDVQDYGPAAHDKVITVSATDLDDKRVNYANWGVGVDIAAPGTDILGLRARRSDLMAGISKYQVGAAFVGEDKRYLRTSGTSFAAPIVAGTASLLLSNNPSLTNEQVKRILLNTAEDIDVAGVDQHTGYGLLDARAALKADPDYYVSARITGVGVVKKSGKTLVQVQGTVDADKFKKAWLELGQGEDPSKWKKVVKQIKKPVTDGVLGEVEAKHFGGAKVWTLRLTTEHKNGTKRPFLFRLNLG